MGDELEAAGCKLRLGPDYLEGLEQDVIFRTPGLHPRYLAEAAAQAAALALLAGSCYQGKMPLLAGIRKAGFHRRVVPGDTLRICAAVTEERPELGWAACRGRVSVQDGLAADIELRLAFR